MPSDGDGDGDGVGDGEGAGWGAGTGDGAGAGGGLGWGAGGVGVGFGRSGAGLGAGVGAGAGAGDWIPVRVSASEVLAPPPQAVNHGLVPNETIAARTIMRRATSTGKAWTGALGLSAANVTF